MFKHDKKKLIIEHKGLKYEYDMSQHQAVRSLNVIVKELNKFFDAYPKLKDYYIEQLAAVETTGLANALVAFAERSEIDEYVRKYGFKLTEEARSDLYVTQDEVYQLLALSLKCKLVLPATIKFPQQEISILQELAKNITVGSKLFRLILNKISTFKHSDSKMWQFLKIAMFDDVEIYAMHLYSFIQRRILITCEVDKNPIVFILSVAGDCMRWISQVSQPLPHSDVPTVDTYSSYLNSKIQKIKQILLQWNPPEPFLTNLEKQTIVGPLQDIWCRLFGPRIGIRKFDAQTAALISIFCAQALLRHNDSRIVAKCPYFVEASQWLPKSTVSGSYINDVELLKRNYKIAGCNVTHLVKKELTPFSNVYLMLDPFTGSKKIVKLLKEAMTFFELVCEGIDDELDYIESYLEDSENLGGIVVEHNNSNNTLSLS